MMNPPTKKADVPAKAEFMIVLEWDKNSGADIDLWIQRDEEDPIGYKNKKDGLIHLDRDDLGHSTDTVTINGVSQIVAINREVLTIRGLVPGEYYVGIHYYRQPSRSAATGTVGQWGENEKDPYDPVVEGTVTFMDVNPYSEVWAQEFTMEKHGTKINLPAVSIDAEGNVTAIYNHMRELGPEHDSTGESASAYNYGTN